MILTSRIEQLVRDGAIFVINHSGGKDSQAMEALLTHHIPAAQIVRVHATLPGEEWEGTLEHARFTSSGPVHVVQAGKTFEDMVRRRGMFPSPKNRQCTSDLKRDPIAKWLRAHSKETGNQLYVHCIGIRAEESPARSKQQPFRKNERESKAGRVVFNWLPIFELSTRDVFATIKATGHEPHWAYGVGMSRLSCRFCIMSCKKDLQIAARYNPKPYAARVALEKEVGHTINMEGKGLEEVTGVLARSD